MSRATQRQEHTDRQERRLHFDVRPLVVFGIGIMSSGSVVTLPHELRYDVRNQRHRDDNGNTDIEVQVEPEIASLQLLFQIHVFAPGT